MNGSSAAANSLRDIARVIFQFALAEANIEKAFEKHVHCTRGVLRICDDLYDLTQYSRVHAISIGKAGHTMAKALAREIGPSRMDGMIVAPPVREEQLAGFRYYNGGHPLPNAESVKAAKAILRGLKLMNQQTLVLFLISGGGSSMLEAPFDPEITLEDLIATYRVLVHSGATITEINAIRKHLSAVKGGRLAQAAAAAGQQVSILVSDVPDNALDALASGPTMPDSSTEEDCYRIAAQYGMLEQFPEIVRAVFRDRGLEETPKSGDPAFVRARWWPILSSATAQNAAAARAAGNNLAVEIDNTCDDWDYRKAADYLLDRLRQLRQGVSRVCLISGGEVTVKVDGRPGVGGRNQQFALYCAEKIAGENICVLSAGTDGIDGNSPAAGAVVDGTTVSRAKAKGLSIEDALRRFDAYPLFSKLGDAVEPGATGNNVRDLRILLAG